MLTALRAKMVEFTYSPFSFLNLLFAFLFFVFSSIGEMAKPNRQLTPINGYLTFNPGVAEQKVSIHSVDDDDPEDDTPYTVVLYSPKGGARLETTSAEFKMRLEGTV